MLPRMKPSWSIMHSCCTGGRKTPAGACTACCLVLLPAALVTWPGRHTLFCHCIFQVGLWLSITARRSMTTPSFGKKVLTNIFGVLTAVCRCTAGSEARGHQGGAGEVRPYRILGLCPGLVCACGRGITCRCCQCCSNSKDAEVSYCCQGLTSGRVV